VEVRKSENKNKSAKNEDMVSIEIGLAVVGNTGDRRTNKRSSFSLDSLLIRHEEYL
jgi:hypothetical protein